MDRFGLTLQSTPPPGRAVEALSYTLVCQPFDYADRGFWNRQRWVTTPRREAALTPKPLEFDPAVEGRFVFHNRGAQNDAGTFLAVSADSAKSVAAVLAGETVRITVTPRAADRPVVLVLGDWVEQAYALAVAQFLQAESEVQRDLRLTADLRLPPPGQPDPREEAEVDGILARDPGLQDRLGAAVRGARERLATATTTLGTADTPATVAAWWQAAQERERLRREVRAAWVTQRLWER